jgi:hypothetical protein
MKVHFSMVRWGAMISELKITMRSQQKAARKSYMPVETFYLEKKYG